MKGCAEWAHIFWCIILSYSHEMNRWGFQNQKEKEKARKKGKKVAQFYQTNFVRHQDGHMNFAPMEKIT